MKTVTTTRPSQKQELFIEALDATREWLAERGIEHRVIGSVATSSYIDPEGQSRLNFDRPGGRTQAEGLPDLDLIIPRESLDEVRAYRGSTDKIKLGLAFPTRFVDFRPAEETSYLMYRGRRLPFKSEVFRPVEKDFLDTPIVTLSPEALLHTHLMMGPIRKKDQNNVRELLDLVGNKNDEAYRAFSEFTREWMENRTLLDASIQTTVNMLDAMPPAVQKRAMRIALALASVAHLR